MKHSMPCLVAIAMVCGRPIAGEEAGRLELLLPLARTVYQTNEAMELAVVRSGPTALPAGDLALELSGTGGSRMVFTFPVPSVQARRGEVRTTEHFRIDGRLLRPGHYTVSVRIAGASASKEIDVVSHIRRSSFRLADWGSRAAGENGTLLSEDGSRLAVAMGADASIAEEIAVPGEAGVVAVAWAGDGMILATEGDSTVRRLRRNARPEESRVLWSHVLPGRVIKRIAGHGGLTALAWWGGTAEILDEAVSVKACLVLPQDIATLSWLGDTPVLGLSDGRVCGLAWR